MNVRVELDLVERVIVEGMQLMGYQRIAQYYVNLGHLSYVDLLRRPECCLFTGGPKQRAFETPGR